MGVPFAQGIRFLFDSHQRFWRQGLDVFLRVKNFNDAGQAYTDLGLQVSASGALSTGFTDIKIAPPPQVRDMSFQDIGLNQARLMFGARQFSISHTFVLVRMQAQGYTDPYQVWRDPLVIGLFYNGRIFTIESITHEEASGDIIWWNLVCNASDRQVTVSGS